MSSQNQIINQVTQAQSLRFELVEVIVTADMANQPKFTFNTDDNLQGKRVLFIDAYNAETMSVSPLGRPVVSVAIFQKATLSLYCMPMSKLNLIRMPFSCLNVLEVPGGTTPYAKERIFLNNPGTDWNKCEIQLGSVAGVGDFSFVLGVWYVDK